MALPSNTTIKPKNYSNSNQTLKIIPKSNHLQNKVITPSSSVSRRSSRNNSMIIKPKKLIRPSSQNYCTRSNSKKQYAYTKYQNTSKQSWNWLGSLIANNQRSYLQRYIIIWGWANSSIANSILRQTRNKLSNK